MSLSKVIPARKVTFVPTWIKKECLVIDQQYRAIRSRMRDPMDKCHWCQVPFEDGDTIALAGHPSGNKVLCAACASKCDEKA